MKSTSPVLVSWIAVNNDPYERDFRTSEYRVEHGEPVPGPTLTLLNDPESPFAGKIKDVVLLHRKPATGPSEKEQRATNETIETLKANSVRVRLEAWPGEDPTDHREIFEFLKGKMLDIRQLFPGRDLIIHISPGTPSMQTIWVLMAETGFIDHPFELVKSYRRSDRRGRPAVVPVEVGIGTFYKAYKSSRPAQVSSEEQGVLWDPKMFQSDKMKAVYAEARRFAQINVPIMIVGERGTGKTTLASWIRSSSPFRQEASNKDWPCVACGQYSPETMRAELFGYKKGSFTGATADRSGLLARAHNDTLFLDEVGDVSRDMQRLLIRAIEEKNYVALGDDKSRESNFRLITATNLDDVELRRRLDPDFFDRISLLTLELPPLREIQSEISWLWEAVYNEALRRSGASGVASLGASGHRRIVKYLQSHPLPGNLRDLFRVAYRVLAVCGDTETPISSADAVEYGLAGLTTAGSPVATDPAVSHAKVIAGAFSESTPIDGVLEMPAFVKTGQVLGEFKAYLATELRRLATIRKVKHKDICDVSDRTLRDWCKK